MFTLVKHSDADNTVVTHYLANKRLVKATKAAGGVTYASEAEASDAAKHYNYFGAEELKPRPQKNGFFSTKKVSGKHIYVPNSTI